MHEQSWSHVSIFTIYSDIWNITSTFLNSIIIHSEIITGKSKTVSC